LESLGGEERKEEKKGNEADQLDGSKNCCWMIYLLMKKIGLLKEVD
jgi:hypothetical protein